MVSNENKGLKDIEIY